MAREVVTRQTVLHLYCSTKIRFESPTHSVTCIHIYCVGRSKAFAGQYLDIALEPG